ncbi:Uu.00g059050.m01.CDS01 [Anthostomella pinea]|uniref:Uu.00g059050.m01.CDS01 n=1 Tax=Anthostomella pinea TaxID=933095 RepID=A0AAI8VS10_9PEZI|nr:Uu.00g059050.m01.CDS01 [Anthostomella pinea]
MASSKEMQTSTRPLTQHRQSISTAPTTSSLSAARQSSHSRNNSHSALSVAHNATHRVTRRKSMTNTTANIAAVAAALQEAGDQVTALPIAVSSRRGTMSKSAGARSAIVGSLPSPPASLPTHRFAMHPKPVGQESAIDDSSNDMSADEGEGGLQKARVRRASDGQPLTKDGKKSNRAELRCDKCGKGYKHSSCLTKHLWEHTPEWSYTSKLLISKHQQVQLLEAASVLVTMNIHEDGTQDSTTPPDSTKDFGSEGESASPAASGFSEYQGGRSSVDTTPPPQVEGFAVGAPAYRDAPKRYSGSSYSRSYQSAASGSFFPTSVPSRPGLGHNRHSSSDRRPPSSGVNSSGQEDRDLAAAVELLSCSFGSNGGTRDSRLPDDAPPVPPLPAQYLDQAAFASTSFINSFPTRQMPESFTRGESRHSEDVKMEDSDGSMVDEEEEFRRSRVRSSEEDDDMMFGRMEE